MTTDIQKDAIHYCEEWLHIVFEGDIEDRDEVLLFLSEYLNEANLLLKEFKSDYKQSLIEILHENEIHN
jgi:hypothetical protein